MWKLTFSTATPNESDCELPIMEGKAPPAVDIADRNALYALMERD
jgi:hypothetical protein